jgi:hypothetical protein
MNNYFNLLKIEHLEGGTYNVDSIIKAIQTFSTWALRVGIAAAGVSLIVGFILYAVVDVDQKPRVKQRIIQTMFGDRHDDCHKRLPVSGSQYPGQEDGEEEPDNHRILLILCGLRHYGGMRSGPVLGIHSGCNRFGSDGHSRHTASGMCG